MKDKKLAKELLELFDKEYDTLADLWDDAEVILNKYTTPFALTLKTFGWHNPGNVKNICNQIV